MLANTLTEVVPKHEEPDNYHSLNKHVSLLSFTSKGFLIWPTSYDSLMHLNPRVCLPAWISTVHTLLVKGLRRVADVLCRVEAREELRWRWWK